jgi:hypothetical protein
MTANRKIASLTPVQLFLMKIPTVKFERYHTDCLWLLELERLVRPLKRFAGTAGALARNAPQARKF